QMLEHDLALIATEEPLGPEEIARAKARFDKNALVRSALAEGGVSRFETVLALELAPPSIVKLVAGEGPLHLLETPRLSHQAAKAFYSGEQAHIHSMRRAYKEFYPAAATETLLSRYLAGAPLTREAIEGFRTTFCDTHQSKNHALCEEAVAMSKWEN